MAEMSDIDIDRSLQRGAKAHMSEPRALSARFDATTQRVVVELANGCAFVFPPQAAQGLETATAAQLSQVEVLGSGVGLHWETLDVDLSVPALLAGLFGTKAWLARQAGQTRSPAKAAAARANGQKGGRPRKTGS